MWFGELRPDPALALDVEDCSQTANTHAGVLTDVWIEGHDDPRCFIGLQSLAHLCNRTLPVPAKPSC